MKQQDRDILQLAVPSIVSNVTVPLLGLVDLTIVGHIGSERYIAAIAVATMIFNVIYWLFGFLRMGTSGMTSQALGRQDFFAVRQLLRQSLLIAMIIAGTFLLLQWPLQWIALELIHPSTEIRPLASTYFNIVIWGAPAMLGLYSLNGWFIGMQTTKMPMTVAIFQNIVNIIVSLVLVFGLGLRMEGVAFGTLVAQWGGFALGLYLMKRKLRAIPLGRDRQRESAADLTGWASFFTVNRDIFLRTLCLVGVNLFFTSAGARQGDMTLAVNTLLMTFFTLFSYVMDGFAFAGEALSGRFYGAADHDGLQRMIRRLFVWGGAMVVAFTAVYIIGGSGFLRLLTDDGAVVEASREYFPWACLIPAAGVAAFIYDGVFIGMTATRGMLVSSGVATVAFFAIFLVGIHLPPVVRHLPSNHLLWLAFIVYLATRGLMQKIYMARKLTL